MLIGYVSTSYGNRALEAVKADIAAWPSRYPQISGFFLDEQASSAAKTDHYGKIYDYIKSQHPGFAVYSNPGALCDAAYVTRPGTDTACLFENKARVRSLCPSWLGRNVPFGSVGRAGVFGKAAGEDEAVLQAGAGPGGRLLLCDRPRGGQPLEWPPHLMAARSRGGQASQPLMIGTKGD